MQTLLRRLGPTGGACAPRPSACVIDWAAIQPFGSAAGQCAAGTDAAARAQPGVAPAAAVASSPTCSRSSVEERQELLDQLDRDIAADALEEMDPEELGTLLRESEPDRAAALHRGDGAGRGGRRLRDLEPDRAEELLGIMPPVAAASLRVLLLYPKGPPARS